MPIRPIRRRGPLAADVGLFRETLRRARESPGEIPGLPTGLAALDLRLGGLQPGELIILAGRTGQGKTGLAMQIAYDVARHLLTTGDEEGVVLVFNGEMSAPALITRELSRQLGIPGQDLLRGLYSDEQDAAVQAELDRIAELPIALDCRAGIDADLIAQAVAAHENPALVVVDHLQLAAKRDLSMYQTVTAAIHTLRELRDVAQCPFLVLSQLKRSDPKGRDADPMPALSDLRDSGAIEEAANQVWMLHNPTAAAAEAETIESGPATLMIAKNRSGWQGRLRLRFFPERTAFECEA